MWMHCMLTDHQDDAIAIGNMGSEIQRLPKMISCDVQIEDGMTQTLAK